MRQRHYLAATVIGWQPGSGGYDEGAPYSGYMDVECRRLFRNRPWLRFENRVHEVLVSLDRSKPIVHIHGGWVIHHFGKVGDRDILRGKGEHYLRILLRKVDDRPDDPQAHHELGVQYSELRQYDEALACFTRVLALSPRYSDTQLQIAICHVGLKQPQQALAALRVAERTLPRLAAEIALAEGNLYRDQGDAAAAERAFRRGIAKNPAYAAVSLNLALLCRSQERQADAIACLDRALQHNPRHKELLTLRMQSHRASGNDEAALADLEALGDEGALRVRARILAQHRRYDQARACLDRIAGQPDAEVSGLRGAIALGSGDLDGAVTHLRASLDAQPACDSRAESLGGAGGARRSRGRAGRRRDGARRLV